MVLKNTIFIFDVDSTLVKEETLEEVMKIALKDDDNRIAVIKKIQEITNLGMEGKLDFKKSLKRRLAVANILQEHLDFYNRKVLPRQIDFKFKTIIQMIKNDGGKVFVISGGFRDNVDVVASVLGIGKEKSFANEFIKENGKVVGFNEDNLLSNSDGKVRISEKIKLANPNKKLICVGDGNSDYLIKKAGVANEFWGFWGNVKRENIEERADRNFYSSEELLEFIKV